MSPDLEDLMFSGINYQIFAPKQTVDSLPN